MLRAFLHTCKNLYTYLLVLMYALNSERQFIIRILIHCKQSLMPRLN